MKANLPADVLGMRISDHAHLKSRSVFEFGARPSLHRIIRGYLV